jgi:hypothetical protein
MARQMRVDLGRIQPRLLRIRARSLRIRARPLLISALDKSAPARPPLSRSVDVKTWRSSVGTGGAILFFGAGAAAMLFSVPKKNPKRRERKRTLGARSEAVGVAK